MPILGDPQGTQARAIDAERKHPVGRGSEPPASYGRRQLIAFALVLALPVFACALLRLLR